MVASLAFGNSCLTNLLKKSVAALDSAGDISAFLSVLEFFERTGKLIDNRLNTFLADIFYSLFKKTRRF